MDARLSPIDEARFGIPTIMIACQQGDSADETIQTQLKAQATLAIVRVPTDELVLVQALEQRGATLADCLVYFRKKQVAQYADVPPFNYTMRLATPADAKRVEELASLTFEGYLGHYHADPRLKREDCDAVYSSWARNSCLDNQVATAVILIEKGDDIAAFATLKSIDSASFEGVLFGVSPTHQGKGLYISLMKLAENWGFKQGHRQMLVSTQVTNTTVQKAWCRLGFEPLKSYYTLHHWNLID